MNRVYKSTYLPQLTGRSFRTNRRRGQRGPPRAATGREARGRVKAKQNSKEQTWISKQIRPGTLDLGSALHGVETSARTWRGHDWAIKRHTSWTFCWKWCAFCATFRKGVILKIVSSVTLTCFTQFTCIIPNIPINDHQRSSTIINNHQQSSDYAVGDDHLDPTGNHFHNTVALYHSTHLSGYAHLDPYAT